MSFILDALKKSEAERQRQSGPALLEMRIVRPERRLPVWAIVVGVLLIVNVAVLGWLAWRPSGAQGNAARPRPTPAMAAGEPARAAPAPVITVPVATTPALAAPATPAAQARAAPGGGVAANAGANDAEENPADLTPAVPAPPGADSNALRRYAELNGTLPELRLDLHVYAAKPADRYAFINMHKVREGDITPEGAHVLEITRDGVVLEFRGTEFLLGPQ